MRRTGWRRANTGNDSAVWCFVKSKIQNFISIVNSVTSVVMTVAVRGWRLNKSARDGPRPLQVLSIERACR